MSFDRRDYKSLVVKRHGDANAKILPMAQLVQGAAVIMDKLQRTEEWERYCTYLQGMSERYKVRKGVALQKLGDPSITKDDDIRKLRLDIFIADVTMDALKFAIELPAAILQGGEEADKFLAQFEEKNEDPTGQPKP